jgi:gamma-glutamyltranspeptidase
MGSLPRAIHRRASRPGEPKGGNAIDAAVALGPCSTSVQNDTGIGGDLFALCGRPRQEARY